jgi:ABC-type multidrug transport system fused ATPase/permease subunit
MDYDRVIVMGDGRILECGTPADLAAIEEGEFAQMLFSAGLLGGSSSSNIVN